MNCPSVITSSAREMKWNPASEEPEACTIVKLHDPDHDSGLDQMSARCCPVFFNI
jgi:hypothetical protein